MLLAKITAFPFSPVDNSPRMPLLPTPAPVAVTKPPEIVTAWLLPASMPVPA